MFQVVLIGDSGVGNSNRGSSNLRFIDHIVQKMYTTASFTKTVYLYTVLRCSCHQNRTLPHILFILSLRIADSNSRLVLPQFRGGSKRLSIERLFFIRIVESSLRD